MSSMVYEVKLRNVSFLVCASDGITLIMFKSLLPIVNVTSVENKSLGTLELIKIPNESSSTISLAF